MHLVMGSRKVMLLRAGHTSHHEDENEAAEGEAAEGWTVIPEAEAQ